MEADVQRPRPANLFMTQQARLALEKKGVILFKDASANKGGVTSSSLEVLSGLSLTDAEFLDLMTTENPEEGVSDFYANYVQEIQRIISINAASEFNCIWKESLASHKPRAVLTDEVGQTLINLQDQLEASELWSNVPARQAVLSLAIPKTLLNHVGLDGTAMQICQLVPADEVASSNSFAAASARNLREELVCKLHLISYVVSLNSCLISC